MTLDQIKLLVKNEVRFNFIVEPAILERGYNIYIQRRDNLLEDFKPLATARKPKQPRLFKSLDAVFGVIVIDLEHDFTVKGIAR